MLILVAGLLVLLCVSTYQVAYNYHKGISPLDLPFTMQKYIRANVTYDVKDALVQFLRSLFALFVIVAYPLTYIMSTLGYYLYKLYNTAKSTFIK